MMTFEEAKKAIEDARATRKQERETAHEREYVEHVFPILSERSDVKEIRIEDAPPGLPGWVVVGCPAKAAMQKFRYTMWEDKAIEAKSKAPAELALATVVYPPMAKYLELVEARNGVIEIVAKGAQQLAAAGAKLEEKK